MSTNQNTNTFSFKNQKGEWVDVPVIYQTAYQAYVSYCNSNNKTPVTIEQFYNAFNVLSDEEFLNQLLEALRGTAALPVTMGGTGATNNTDALANLGITYGSGAPTSATPGIIYFQI